MKLWKDVQRWLDSASIESRLKQNLLAGVVLFWIWYNLIIITRYIFSITFICSFLPVWLHRKEKEQRQTSSLAISLLHWREWKMRWISAPGFHLGTSSQFRPQGWKAYHKLNCLAGRFEGSFSSFSLYNHKSYDKTVTYWPQRQTLKQLSLAEGQIYWTMLCTLKSRQSSVIFDCKTNMTFDQIIPCSPNPRYTASICIQLI